MLRNDGTHAIVLLQDVTWLREQGATEVQAKIDEAFSEEEAWKVLQERWALHA